MKLAHATVSANDDAPEHLLYLLAQVASTGYRFITPTPSTHRRFLDHRDESSARSLRDIFGWNQVFQADAISPLLLRTMTDAQVLRRSVSSPDDLRSNVRIASIDADLFLHSAFPTNEEASIFFGPDTYRFVHFVRTFITSQQGHFTSHFRARPLRMIDIGCGSGAGGIAVARTLAASGHDTALTLTDISPEALRYAAINAAFAKVPATTLLSDGLQNTIGEFDLIILNPPYMQDDAKRLYRHGGDQLGRALSVRLASESLERLAPGGTLLLYTGVAIVDGIDGLHADLQIPLQQSGCRWTYTEIDPDVFGEELVRPAYRHAERIAAVGLIATRSPNTRT